MSCRGTLGDGASGLLALKQAGGITVVQDPDDAALPDMPGAALSRAQLDHVGLLALLEKLGAQAGGVIEPGSGGD